MGLYLVCCSVAESESRESKVFTGSRSQSRSRKKELAGVRSLIRTKINPGSQSRSWSRTEKMAESHSWSKSRTDFAWTLQHWFVRW